MVISKGYDEITHLEAVGRTHAGVTFWLALSDDDTEEGKLRKQMREEVLKGLKNAVDPASPDRLNFTKQTQPVLGTCLHMCTKSFVRTAGRRDQETLHRVTQGFTQPYRGL